MENQESHIFIDGIGLSGYRSFGDEVQRIGPFGKINLFIGKNNSGKSNIILFLKQHYSNIRWYSGPIWFVNRESEINGIMKSQKREEK